MKKPINNLAIALQNEKKHITKYNVSKEPKTTTVQCNFRIDKAAKNQLEHLRIEIGAKNLQALLIEAVNDVFEKYGKDRIA